MGWEHHHIFIIVGPNGHTVPMSSQTEHTAETGGGTVHEIGHDEPAETESETMREIGHDEFEPVGTLLLVLIYFVIIGVMWGFMYFIEFLGNGPTVV